MEKKRYLLVFTVIVTMLLGSFNSFAVEDSARSMDAANILNSSETLQIGSTALPVVNTSAGIVAVVRNFSELEAALLSGDISGAYLFNDLEMAYPLSIDKDFSFELLLGEVTITSAPASRHFIITGDNITIDFGGTRLDGQDHGGGLTDNTASALIKNGILANCLVDPADGGAINSNTELTLENFTVADIDGRGIFAQQLYLNSSSVERCTQRGIFAQGIELTDSAVHENLDGGIYCEGTVIMHSGEIYDNTAVDGGGVWADTFIMKSGLIHSNVAENGGGGIYGQYVHIDGSALTEEDEPLQVSGNYAFDGGNVWADTFTLENGYLGGGFAENRGGGVFARSVKITSGGFGATNAAYGGAIYADECIVDNCYFGLCAAEVNGGAIHVPITNLEVGPNTSFESTHAFAGGYFMVDPDDIALHHEKIHTTQFNNHFYYLYNNFDIAYTKGYSTEEYDQVRFYLTKSSEEVYATKYVLFDNPLGEFPTQPTMPGYQFVGWYDYYGNLLAEDTIINYAYVYAAWIIL